MAEQSTTDDRIKSLLRTLATADPDYDRFAQEHALLQRQPLPPDEEAALGRDLLDVLRESPEQETRIEALLHAPPPSRYDAGLATVPVLVAATFLLRTHIRIKRGTNGKYEIEIEHKPADSKLLTQLLNKIMGLLPGGSD